MESSLVILGCTDRKSASPGLIPAIDRYDGPSVRVLRKFVRESPATNVRACFVSGQYGLIRDDYPLPEYDHRLRPEDEERLLAQVSVELGRTIAELRPSRFFVSTGSGYWRLLEDAVAQEIPNERLVVATGAMGGRTSRLAAWLRSGAPERLRSVEGTGQATLLGTTVRLSAEQVLKTALAALSDDGAAASRFETWFVPVGPYRVAPKWLVGVLFAKPVARFRTADALRVLSLLGVASLRADRD